MKQKKAKSRVRKGQSIRQIAALPYRCTAPGDIEFLILTSRTTGRFIVPKGWPMKGMTEHEAAAEEAKQEAGVVGNVGSDPIGSYQYWKRLRTVFVPVIVAVYSLEVTAEFSNWRERKQRQKQWMRREEATRLIDEPELVSLISAFERPS